MKREEGREGEKEGGGITRRGRCIIKMMKEKRERLSEWEWKCGTSWPRNE